MSKFRGRKNFLMRPFFASRQLPPEATVFSDLSPWALLNLAPVRSNAHHVPNYLDTKTNVGGIGTTKMTR